MTDEVDGVRNLVVLAVEILDAHSAYLATQTSAIEHAKHAGELLIEAKKQLDQHGAWLPWLAAHCPALSPRVAQGYMRIAREWPRLLAKTKHVSYLPIRDALTILADEWTDPNELGSGGSKDLVTDDEDDDGDPAQYLKMFRAFFQVDEYAEFRQQFDALKPRLRTASDSETLKKVVQLVHSTSTSAEDIKEDDADDSAHRQQLATER